MGRIIDRLRCAEEQIGIRLKCVMEDRAGLPLQLSVKIDEEVAAEDQVEAREGGVFEQAVGGEKDEVAELTLDPVVIAVLDEETIEPLGADIRLDRDGVAAFARNR